MGYYNELLHTNTTIRARYERAHEEYLLFRHLLALHLGDSEEHITGVSAGGMPGRVKCLHALVAQSLVMGRGVNPIGDLTLQHIADEFSPDMHWRSGGVQSAAVRRHPDRSESADTL